MQRNVASIVENAAPETVTTVISGRVGARTALTIVSSIAVLYHQILKDRSGVRGGDLKCAVMHRPRRQSCGIDDRSVSSTNDRHRVKTGGDVEVARRGGVLLISVRY